MCRDVLNKDDVGWVETKLPTLYKAGVFIKKNSIHFIKKLLPDNKSSDDFSFSLILIMTSGKLKKIIGLSQDGTHKPSVSSDEVRQLLEDSFYFVLENKSDDILKDAKLGSVTPDLTKENLFVVKINGQGASEIGKYQTKGWIKNNITSDTCSIEQVSHLLDASISSKFIPTI